MKRKLASSGIEPVKSTNDSFEMPATNKAMAEKIEAYRHFLSEYLVKSTLQRDMAVKSIEKKITSKYQSFLAKMEDKYPFLPLDDEWHRI